MDRERDFLLISFFCCYSYLLLLTRGPGHLLCRHQPYKMYGGVRDFDCEGCIRELFRTMRHGMPKLTMPYTLMSPLILSAVNIL